jgi:hypothetical protein
VKSDELWGRKTRENILDARRTRCPIVELVRAIIERVYRYLVVRVVEIVPDLNAPRRIWVPQREIGFEARPIAGGAPPIICPISGLIDDTVVIVIIPDVTFNEMRIIIA